ncbi:uncharacterized protein LOC110773323 [Prunus avium]|uniref:Uncharacterized protein LOC110773323 n=1 Tax=Prunus avium TaxID=42229 RepID=A0A6P5U0G9_PRUAV|nr:uncharacterized protein LOC110773323 [Prunus avium]
MASSASLVVIVLYWVGVTIPKMVNATVLKTAHSVLGSQVTLQYHSASHPSQTSRFAFRAAQNGAFHRFFFNTSHTDAVIISPCTASSNWIGRLPFRVGSLQVTFFPFFVFFFSPGPKRRRFGQDFLKKIRRCAQPSSSATQPAKEEYCSRICSSSWWAPEQRGNSGTSKDFSDEGRCTCASLCLCGSATGYRAMEGNTVRNEDEVEEEYVLLDLDSAYSQFDILPNAPYVLSGLNTEHPVLTIGDKLNLIGEYHETVGTCLIFKEEVASPVVHEETGPSEANLFAGKCIVDPNQPQSKQVKPVTSLHRIIKFRLAPNVDSDDASKQTPDQVQHTVHSMGNDQHENP